jgi:hypothetical protein
MTFKDLSDILLSQTEGSLNLTLSDFYAPLIQSFPSPDFFVPLSSIKTVFPKTTFYSVRSMIIDQNTIHLVSISAKFDPKHFTLILRYHQQSSPQLEDYLDSELMVYDQMEFQKESFFFPVGYASIPNGWLAVFLSTSTQNKFHFL